MKRTDGSFKYQYNITIMLYAWTYYYGVNVLCRIILYVGPDSN